MLGQSANSGKADRAAEAGGRGKRQSLHGATTVEYWQTLRVRRNDPSTFVAQSRQFPARSGSFLAHFADEERAYDDSTDRLCRDRWNGHVACCGTAESDSAG